MRKRRSDGESSGASALWTVAAQVLDRDRVSPGNVVGRNAERGGQALALRRTRRVVAAYDGLDKFRIQTRAGGKLANAHSSLFHAVCDSLHDDRNLITLLRHRL